MVESKETKKWEKINISTLDKDSIKFVSDDKLNQETTSIPSDKNKLVYMYFFLQGVGTLIPWNLFITIAPMYFINYKLKDATQPTTPTFYAINFFSFLGFFANFPQLFLQGVNIIAPMKGNLSRRIKMSIPCIGSIVGLTIILIFVDISSWMDFFFWITMMSVAFMCAMNGIYQNSMFGLAANFPQKYTNGMILGANVCGTFVSLINIITIAAINNVQLTAFVYFLIALVTLVICFFSTFLIEKNKYYKYHISVCTSEKETLMKDHSKQESVFEKLVFVWDNCYDNYINIFVLFFITLACFPHMLCDIPIFREDGIYDFIVPEKFYVPVFTFLLFNFGTVIGTIAADYIKIIKPRYYWIPIYLRFSILIILFFCNYHPTKRILPIFIFNEWIPIALNILLAITNAYFTSVIMMHIPKSVDSNHASIAVPKCLRNHGSKFKQNNPNKNSLHDLDKRRSDSSIHVGENKKKKKKKKAKRSTNGQVKYMSQKNLLISNSSKNDGTAQKSTSNQNKKCSLPAKQIINLGEKKISEVPIKNTILKDKVKEIQQKNLLKVIEKPKPLDIQRVVSKNPAPILLMQKNKTKNVDNLLDVQNTSEIKLDELLFKINRSVENFFKNKDKDVSIEKKNNIRNVEGKIEKKSISPSELKKPSFGKEASNSIKGGVVLPEEEEYEQLANLINPEVLILEKSLNNTNELHEHNVNNTIKVPPKEGNNPSRHQKESSGEKLKNKNINILQTKFPEQ